MTPMGLFALTCTDRTDAGDLRARTRERHLAYLNEAGVSVKIGGPLLDSRGERPVGSLLLIEAADLEAATAFAAADPYAQAGLFSSVDIKPWRLVVGAFG
jgi:uncharacterized protein YciI